MNLFCDNKYCKYNMSYKCLKNDKECPYQKELRDRENKKHYTVDTTKDIIQPLFDAIDQEKSQGVSIHVPKTIAKIKFLGTALVIGVPDNCKGFIKPTKRQIKNLKKHFCIDVELMDEVK